MVLKDNQPFEYVHRVGQLHAAGVETGQYEALDFDKNCFGDAEAVLNEARSP